MNPTAGAQLARSGPTPPRNRARILAAAEAVFATEGIEVLVDVIAEKAGVGVGTLYRHFPTKEKLCEAILLERLESLTVDAQALADAGDPSAAFFGFLDHMVEESAAKRDLIVAVMGAGLAFDLSAFRHRGELSRCSGGVDAASAGDRCSQVRRDSHGGDGPGRRDLRGRVA